MDNFEDIENPEEELRKLDRVISQFKLVLRSSTDPAQKDRAGTKLKGLMVYRAKLVQMFNIAQGPVTERREDESDVPTYMSLIMQDAEAAEAGGDEIQKLGLYLHFYDQEFLRVFSSRRLRLDFQHSLERDGYYSRFQELTRKLDDIAQENRRSETTVRSEEKLDLRKRVAKMNRVLSVEADKYFTAVNRFVTLLIDDLDQGGVKCLNGDEQIQFDDIEGKRFLEGETVYAALVKVRDFSLELLSFLDVPEFQSREP